jgi:hypothetical protein
MHGVMKFKITIVATDPGQLVRCTLNGCNGTSHAPVSGCVQWKCEFCNQNYDVILLDYIRVEGE